MIPATFPNIRFSGQLRTSQVEVAEIAKRQLDKGQRRLHIVAPPGSGKTILGLYLWAELIRQPAVILSPNSAIQSQWAARTDLFHQVQANTTVKDPANLEPKIALNPAWISTDSQSPSLLTSLTYQSVTLPQRGNDHWDQTALELWADRLVEKGQAEDLLEAEVWIEDLQRHNPEYYDDRLSIYRKRHRDGLAADGRNLDLLHDSSRKALQAAKEAGIGVLILDECHHLVGHWGRVLSEAIELLGNPIVIGLTATPPDITGKPIEDIQRYETLLGPIDYEVPVPAVVKDGFLAPYQDLVYFVRPTAQELTFISNVDGQFRDLLGQLCQTESVNGTQPEENSPPNQAEPFAVDDKDRNHQSAPATTTKDLLNAGNHTQTSHFVPKSPDTSVPQDARTQSPTTQEDADEKKQPQAGSPNAPIELISWVKWTLETLTLPTGRQVNWKEFQRRDPSYFDNARLFLLLLGFQLPADLPAITVDNDLQPLRQRNLALAAKYEQNRKPSNGSSTSDLATVNQNSGSNAVVLRQPMRDPRLIANQLHDLPLEILTPILDRFIRHRLRRSPDLALQQLAESLISRLRMLGIQVTETGSQACASPISRVLAYSQSKTQALTKILAQEMRSLGANIRCVVVTDFEKTSAVHAEIKDILDQHAGGAVAAFRTLLLDDDTNRLDPILLTGTTILVDEDLCDRFLKEASQWLVDAGHSVKLNRKIIGKYCEITGVGSDWCPRVYVQLITEFFQQGLTRCLVGTRGLLGEGWDASRTNTLIDLTTVTTSMSINQLRGRSIRLDKHWPEKLANNWDIVCVAPEFAKGFDDFHRFKKKHNSLFGVTDDGQIEKGAGHVHAMMNEVRPENLFLQTEFINQQMLDRAQKRAQCRQQWKIGGAYEGQITHSVELRPRRPNQISSTSQRHFAPFGWNSQQWSEHSLSQEIATVILETLMHLRMVQHGNIVVGDRGNSVTRLFMATANANDAKIFAQSLSEVLGPIDDARYIIPRKVDVYEANWLSRWFPEFAGRLMQSKKRQLIMWHAVPTSIATKKEFVLEFQKHWNKKISPGQALYAHRGDGNQQLTQSIANGLTPDFAIHQTEIFR